MVGAAEALVHFSPTRNPHHGDMLTTKQRNKRHDNGVSGPTAASDGWDEGPGPRPQKELCGRGLTAMSVSR